MKVGRIQYASICTFVLTCKSNKKKPMRSETWNHTTLISRKLIFLKYLIQWLDLPSWTWQRPWIPLWQKGLLRFLPLLLQTNCAKMAGPNQTWRNNGRTDGRTIHGTKEDKKINSHNFQRSSSFSWSRKIYLSCNLCMSVCLSVCTSSAVASMSVYEGEDFQAAK